MNFIMQVLQNIQFDTEAVLGSLLPLKSDHWAHSQYCHLKLVIN